MLVVFLIAGCGAPAATPISEAPAATPILEPAAATPTPVPPTATPTQIPPVGTDITIELPEGDPERGQAIAEDEIRGLDGFSLIYCSQCHVGDHPIGPNFEATDELPAIGERGAIRIAEPDYRGAATTPEQYLFESIVLPKAYYVEGPWLEDMQEDYGQRLSRQDTALLSTTASGAEPLTDCRADSQIRRMPDAHDLL